MELVSRFWKIFRFSSKFSLLLLGGAWEWRGWGTSKVFVDAFGGAGGDIFLFLVDFLIPRWGRRAIVGPILINSFCPNWGCGLVSFFVDFLGGFSWGVVGFL